MGTRIVLHSVTGLLISFILTSHLINVTQGSKVWGEVALPEDLEAERAGARYPAETDDEDFAADEASGDHPSGEEDGSTPEPTTVGKAGSLSTMYYRALVNFTDSFVYSPDLENIYSDAFLEISDAVVDTLESEYNRITGVQTVSVVIIRKIGENVFVELDVASDYNSNDEQIRSVLYSVVMEGSIASYVTSVEGFEFRRLGEVVPSTRPCLHSEFTCHDGGCIPQEYYCDKRPDCLDMSDELDCEPPIESDVPPTPPKVLPEREPPRPPVGGPCQAGQATCQNGECIPRDYLCDGERDCTDGSDELKCGTPSPCEPNEFKCQNGRCALKLWRCDGDNDCGDNSDESYCPTKGPGDTCAPEQFMCVMDRTCIPASYQCDEESDCPDRSDEYDCSPPLVTSPPEESVKAQRGQTVTFTCTAVGVPTPIITWRLNWGHIPTSSRITVTNNNGRGTLTIRDVKEGDQGAYTCEAINAKGMVFAVPDGVLSLTQNTGNCPSGHFSVAGSSRCIPCFCFGITKNCQNTGRYRNQIHLRFTDEDDFKGVNVSYPSRPGTPPLSSTQLLINPETEEFQLVDLSRRFLILDSYWTLPRQFLGNKIDSYGGSLKYKVRFILARGETEPQEKPDVVLVGNGQRLIYRRGNPTPPSAINQKEVKFTEENWQHSSGRAVTREDLMMTLVNLESINIRTIYDNRMVSVALSDIVMDTATVEYSLQGPAQKVEECRCPPGYSGLSCEICTAGFDRVSGGSFLGTCAGCNCNGHASDCDPISGHCLSCQHNTEGAQCDKCRPGYFGDPRRGRPDDCKPCPCPYTETSRRFSDTCFLDHDNQATCDACRPGYTGRRCERCAPGYQGNPLQPNGKCVPSSSSKCDNRGTVNFNSRPCSCKPNVVGALCDECKIGSFHLSEANPDGCLQCFCMGVTKQCASSSWSRDQVRGGVNGQLFTLSNGANTRSITQGILQKSSSEVAFRSFADIPTDIYYWVLPESFRGDKVTAYGGELRYTVRYEPRSRSLVIDGQPDVVLQGNGIFLEHFSKTKPLPRVPATITVPFREGMWRRADGQPCTREHLLMALADTSVFMIRATYADNMAESSMSDVRMDIAVPHSTGNERALEVEECACPQGYRGPSCQECDVGYSRTGSGLYLGTCERCDCYGHASSCDADTGDCLQCQHNTIGPRCDRCTHGYYGNPKSGSPAACQPCPCPGTSSGNQYSRTCHLASDGQPTCDNCPAGHTGRRCERCTAGYTGNPQLGQACTLGTNEVNGNCHSCDRRGTERCEGGGICRCKTHVVGPACSSCKPGHFHLSSDHDDGCLACFCMGVTQQCTSSNYYRDTVSSVFSPGNFQDMALVNRQRTNRITTGFTVEVSSDGGTQLSFSNFGNLDQEAHYWQLPDAFKGDKREAFYARMRREHKKDSPWTEEQLRKDASVWKLMDSTGNGNSRSKRAAKSSAEIQKLDDEIWALISNFSKEPSPPSTHPIPFSVSSALLPPPSSLSSSSSSAHSAGSYSHVPGYSTRHQRPQTRPQAQQGPNVVSLRGARPGSGGKYALVYKGFSLHPEDVLFWQLPPKFRGDKVGSYGGTLRYTISYVAGQRGTGIEDADVQLIGNDITLVSHQTWHRGQGARESRQFDVAFKEEHWRRPDGMPTTREHLMMVLADLDDVLIRASSYTDMLSASISDIRMEVAVPNYSGLAQALEVEQCRCPPGYQGLSCQDCAPGYSRNGGGLYLGHCELCECNGHSDSCHPETGVCTNCLHNTMGELCEQCAAGYFGDPTAGTPEDCQPCACPHMDPDYQFSPTCESTGNGGYHCTACQPGYTGQYCERCAPGYEGDPQRRDRCRPYDNAASLVVRVHPDRIQVSQGSPVTLRCQGTGSPPHYFYWSREDRRPVSSRAERRRHGEELYFPSIEASDAGVYICTCRDVRSSNTSRAEIVVTTVSNPIEVTVEEPKTQSVTVGSAVSFICTAKSQSPAYTLVWTRKGNRKLPHRATDFNGILTIQNVHPEDAGIYVCTGSNMFAMDEGTAVLYVPEASQTQMFYTAYEMFEGHRTPSEGSQAVATVHPPVLTVQQGQRAEFRCTTTGSPAPAIEWIGGQGNRISPHAIIRGGVLTIPAVERSDEGEYICKALNTHGEHSARAVLYVHSASLPHVQVSPQRVEIHEGETLRLYCRAGGTPSPGLTWKKRGGQLPPQAIPSHGFHQFKTNSLDVLQRRIEELQARMERTDIGTLLISNIRAADAGTYLCVGTNSIGSSEAPIEVSVARAEPISSVVTIQPPFATVEEGQTLDLNCVVPGSPPNSVTWIRVGGHLSSNHQVLGTQLRILRASPDDSGEYICRVAGGPRVRQASVTVSVTPSSSSKTVSSAVTIQPAYATVEEGQTLDLSCVVPGRPPISVTWIRVGRRLSSNHQVLGTQLRILRASPDDSGEYICRVAGGPRVRQASVTVSVTSSSSVEPISTAVSIEPHFATVEEGQTLDLECLVPGSPPNSVTWIRVGRRLSSNHQVLGTQLRILRASPDDSGEYICRVEGGPRVRQASVTVSVTPHSSLEPISTAVSIEPPFATVEEGQTLDLECLVPGSPPNSVTWIRGGRQLSSNHQVLGTQLRILRVSPDDSGEYICMVEGGPTVRQASVMVIVTPSSSLEPISSVVTIDPPYATVEEGQTLDLNCVVPGRPPISVTWIRVGRHLSSNHQVLGTQLRILRASQDDSGEYICRVEGGPTVRQASVTVSVSPSSSLEPISSVVTIDPPYATVEEGQTLDLHCVVPGRPPISVTWMRVGRHLSSNHQVLGTQLRILRASQDDSGEYICRVEGGPTVRQASVTVSVSPSSSLEPISSIVTIDPPYATVEEGQTLDLHCVVPGRPPISVTWMRVGRHLSSNHQVLGTQLRILRTSQDDSGEYICRVEGGPRIRQASVTVSVTPSSSSEPISSAVTIEPSIASVQEGQPLDLTCVVPGSPPISVTWIRVGRHLSSNHQVVGTQLRILQASEDDSGEYICRVEDGPMARQASVIVSVTASSSRPQTPIISIEPHTAAVRQGETASFRCRIHTGAQPVRLEWKLSNNRDLADNVRVSPDGAVITISNVQSSDQGTYRCVASNVFGITQSIVSLTVRESPKAVVTPQGLVRVRVGEPINLECQGSGEPRPTVSWHRLDSGRRTMLTSPVPMDSNAVMQVLAARPEDSGTYICTVQNMEGTSDVRVEVRVEGGEQVPTAPRASVAEPLLVVEEGQTVTLRCQAHGTPTPTITWSKLRSPLPWRHRVVNDSLILPGVGRQDSGQYICNATNSLGTSEVTVMLDVETPPYATSLPDDLAVRVGEVIRLQCLSHGTPPLRFEWTKVNGSLPGRAEVDNGNLQINLATVSDAGTYKCTVSNKVGSSESLAKVAVRSPLSVRVWPQVEVKAVGSAVEFTCSAAGGIQTAVEWLKEGGPMPVNHHIKDGVLRIENLEQSNEGMYICRATGVYGQAQDTAKLTIQALPKVMINVRTSVQTVMIGNAVEFECQAIGDPQPSVRWSKVGGELPAHVVVRGGMLKIEQVTEADAGQYRCTATNNVGSVQSEVVLNVQSLPQITAPPEVKEVNLGSAAVFPCLATGYPVPEIKWSKLDGELGPTAVQEGHVLTIPSVKQEDSGTYVCSASNKQGTVQAFTKLSVHERVMPHFTQTPLSYLTLPTIKNSYKAFTIKINFRPDSADGVMLYAGMIIYNGQKRTTGADFVSLGLVGGRPEFRFDVGSGMATIRYPTPIKLGEFHTVELHRNLTTGSIMVDGDTPVNGSSQGKFQGLDLNEDLFIGGYPNYTVITKTTGLKTGFVGCIRQLIIQGEEVIFKDLDRSSTGVSNCPSCRDYPCQNGGRCQDSDTSIYKCSCARGYTGSNCEHHSSLHCHSEACGADATCINRPSGLGYDCRCHLGKSGDKCMQGILVTTPHFDGEDSYIAYPPLTNIHNDLRVEIEFKPLDPDGLMFFSGGKKMKVEDFVAVSMVDGHVEFRYELGTGMAVLRSWEPVTLRQWHRVVAERLNKDGSLKVDQAQEVRRSSPGKAQGLNIHTPMYLGGVPSMDILPKPANVSMLFEGCVGEVSINGKKVDLSYSFMESRAILQCVDNSPCDRRPCLNGGSCMSNAEYEYQCLCQDGFEGERCEVVKDVCHVDAECQNGGRCASGQCVCPGGYSGLHCEAAYAGQAPTILDTLWNMEGSGGNDAPAQYAAYFHDDGYLVLPKPVFPRSSPDAPETIELEIRTTTSEGLILWQGVESSGTFRKLHASKKELGEEGKGKDFISLGLQSGQLVFSYQLGSGEAEIIFEEPINDGKWHKVTAVRTGKLGYVQVDGGPISRGHSQGKSVMVNTKGNVFLGGAPDMAALTGGKFSSGMTGCVKNLALTNTRPGEQPARPIDLQAHAQEGINVERCSS
ncbi:basement membrane-specific heparan sulfate proteoglycan core protein-like isoform X3 [Conger conger]|uniref:basement membrane-specific heparan sulfate proteoglycan core protein-like isoform X3 n=1 Tax=Conger conger TaxID=82655 RepID=UPI002A59D365|nr:basement membrane-specific heparan sulfate proteoglycan core protein-like isoform X3 [Conger conger]